MKSPLRILHLEDDPNDAALVEAILEADGITCSTTCVDNHEDFLAALERGGIDLILSDFGLPSFDGLSAIEIAQAEQPDLPVILVSGTLGEELAIEALKSGATDYILKERMSRLVPAVRRAMHDVEERGERRRMEVQFIEAQKMDLLGQLAGGVSHDFNNILGIIIGYSEMIAADLDPDHALQAFATEIRQAAERGAGLTRQLLVFSRKETVQPVVLDLNGVVKDLHKMLRRLIDSNITMTIEPGSDIGRVKADAGYLGQVLMNLVVNARDAMPDGGQLTIATRNVTIADLTPDENDAHLHPGVIPGDYVLLSVSDTGTGMSDEVKLRLFEALFTTKPKGKGTGLGLATCQTIVHQSGGHIGVSSELGAGTTFKIYFPRVDQPLDVAAQTIPAGPLPRGTETLLVVDDEPALRTLARGVLEAQGYEVVLVSNGQEALQAAREHQGAPIRLVITSIVLPQMGGKAMAEWLKTADPDLKILFTSGYTDEVIARRGAFETGVGFLSKPYTPALLAHKVREMLDS